MEEDDGVALPVISACCDYRQSARYDDELEIRTRGAVVSPVRVRFDYEVARAADGIVLATGRTLHAALDRNGKPCRLPPRVRQLLPRAADDERETRRDNE
jgi:acyl-CoA thioester hydrolase